MSPTLMTSRTTQEQRTRLILLTFGVGAVTGIHLGLLHLFLWRNAWAPVFFTAASLIFAAGTYLLQQSIFPRLPGRTLPVQVAWQALASLVTFSLICLVSYWLFSLWIVIPPLFGTATGVEQTLVITPETRQLAVRFYTLLPLVPTTLMALISYHQVWQRVHHLEDRAREMGELAAAAQLAALRAQINPHFLFNSLNSIAQLIHVDPDKAEACVERLAEIFRYLLRRAEQEFVSLSEELAVAEAYLEIERARFGERLHVETRIDADSLRQRIPSLILQPLVENAVKHGLSRKIGAGTVRIRAHVDGRTLRLTVADDGVGMGSQALAAIYERGVGLRNIRARLERLYGAQHLPEIVSTPGNGTSVRLTLPLEAA